MSNIIIIFNKYLILFYYFLLTNSIIFAYDLSSVLDNFIIGTPKVICEETEVAMDIITAKPFIGNIFVKGRAKDNSCRQSFSDSPNIKNGSSAYTLSLGKCGMQRLRSASPRGINFAVTLVVSFHPAGFITKNDKAFHLSCFYTEPEEIVTSSFEVSHLPPQELSDQMSMPSCRYSVHSTGWDGPQLSWANVGDTVYHVWECRGPEMGMLIKKCFVTDGDGDDHAVVDENGCSLDLGLIDEIIYSDDGKMRAYAKSHVFKYADSNQLFFTCQIRMCQRQMDMCQGITPPKCSGQQKETKMKTKLIKQHNKDENKFKNEENEFNELPETAQIEKVLVKESEADWSLDSGVILEDNIKQNGKFVKGVLKQEMLKKEEKQSKNEEKKEEKENKIKEEIKQKDNNQKQNNKDKKEEEQKNQKEGIIEHKEELKNNNLKIETNQENKNNIEKKFLEKRERIAEKEEEQDNNNNGGEEETEKEENNDWSLIVNKGRGRRALIYSSSPLYKRNNQHQLEVDVASPQMLVLDREDFARIGKLKEEKIEEEEKEELNNNNNYCFGIEKIIFGIFTLILTIFGGILLIFWHIQKCWKKRNNNINETFYFGGKLLFCR